MSSIENKNYLKVTYPDKKSSYPAKLAEKLFGDIGATTYVGENIYHQIYPIYFPKYEQKKVLDIGCGNGDLTNEIHKLGFDVYASDIHQPEDHSFFFVHNDISKEKLPYGDNKFDIVFSKSVIEHLKEPEQLISEAYRVLRPGGKLILMTPSYKHSHSEAFYIDHTHCTPFTRISLENICKIHGFEDAKCEYFYQLPIVWKYPKLLYICKIINLFKLPYRPLENVKWPESFNKFLRFSKEAMLLCQAEKK